MTNLSNAKKFEASGHIDKALQLYKQGIKKGEKNCLDECLNFCLRNNLNKEFIYLCENAIYSGDKSKRLRLAKYYCSINDNNNAEKHFEICLDEKIKSAKGIYGIYCCTVKKNYVKSEELLNSAILEEPEDPNGYYGLAEISKKNENYVNMTKYLLSAYKYKFYPALINLADYYLIIKDLKMSAAYYKKAAEEVSPDYYYNCGIIYKELKEYEKAKKNFLNGYFAENTRCGYELGRLYDEENNFVEAMKYYNYSSLKISEAYYRMGIIHEKTNKIDFAKHNYMLGSLKDCNKCSYRLGELYEKDGDNNEAEKYYYASLALNNSGAFFPLINNYVLNKNNDKLKEMLALLSKSNITFDKKIEYYKIIVKYYKTAFADKYIVWCIYLSDKLNDPYFAVDVANYLNENKTNIFLMTKCYIIGMELGNEEAKNKLREFINNDVNFYIYLKNFNNKNIIKITQDLEKDENIIRYNMSKKTIKYFCNYCSRYKNVFKCCEKHYYCERCSLLINGCIICRQC